MNPAAIKSLLLTLALLMTLPAAAQHPGWFSGDAGDFASASGTWTGNESLTTLLYGTRIECWHSQKMCVAATARADMGEPWIEYFDILTWDKDELIARQSVICGADILRFDFVAKTVSNTVVPNGNPGYLNGCTKYLPQPAMLTGSLQDRVKKKAK